MKMEKALNFLARHRDVVFATAEAGNPRIRVFEIMKIEGQELFFATSSSKGVYRQLLANPNVEILAMEGDISVRASGKVLFDLEDSLCREIYLSNAVLQRLYMQYADLVYFRLPICSLDYYDLAPTPVVTEHYESGDAIV